MAVRFSVLPSENDKIKESVMVGSVFLALENKFFTHESLLKWLDGQPCESLTMVAYKAVCEKIHPDKHYLAEDVHFLGKNPEYLTIAIGYKLDTAIFIRLFRDFEDLHRIIYTDPKSTSRRHLILMGKIGPELCAETMDLCYLSRNFPLLRRVSVDTINASLVEADWISKFCYNEGLASKVLCRVTKLQTKAPIYYVNVAYREYHTVAVRLNKGKLLYKLTRDELATFNTFFPHVIDSRVLTYPDLAYKLAMLTSEVAGYFLGFPIQSMIPNDSQIHEALEILIAEGVEKYLQRIKQSARSVYMPVSHLPTQTLTFINDQDVTCEDIDDYLPFDIVAYQSGQHIYRFTRVEFQQLSDSKKNHWNNELLPSSVLSVIRSRLVAARELRLPKAKTAAETFESIAHGDIFEDNRLNDTSTVLLVPQENMGLGMALIMSIMMQEEASQLAADNDRPAEGSNQLSEGVIGPRNTAHPLTQPLAGAEAMTSSVNMMELAQQSDQTQGEIDQGRLWHEASEGEDIDLMDMVARFVESAVMAEHD